MKKLNHRYILIFLIAIFSFANKVDASLIGTVNVNDSLTLRESPTTSGGIITSLYNGTELNILEEASSGNGCTDNWYKISYENHVGYVCGTYLEIRDTSVNNEDDTYSRDNYNNAPKKDGTVACYEDTGSITLRNSANGSYLSGKKIDCGDEVNIEETVETNSTKCRYWYKVNTGSYSGYVCAYFVNTTKLSSTAQKYYDNKTNGDTISSYQEELSEAGFPESYWPYLLEIHARNTNWNFVAERINLNFDDVVEGQAVYGRSLLHGNAFDDGYLSIASETYNVFSDTFSEYPGEPGWYNASKEAIAYYLDPRTYLNEKYIFGFETLEFKENQSASVVKNFFNGKTLFNTPYSYYNNLTKGSNGLYSDGSTGDYSNDIVNASRNSNISSLHISSRILQEVGATGSASSTGGSFTYCGQNYSGYYNFFNIGAYATSCATNIQNGLYYAKSQGWNTPYKSIVGGTGFIANNYVALNQDTIYYERFDVSTSNGNYTHQYQQNLTAPISEGGSTFVGYFNGISDYLKSGITFVIPVYNNMPTYAVTTPKLGNPNNYLKSLTVNGTSVSNFNYDTYNYNIYLNESTTSVTIAATAINGSSKINGIGAISINSNEQTNQIIVTAGNGKNRTYTIKFIRKESTPITVKEVMDNSGFKYNDTYLFGINVGTNVSSLIGNITNYNNSAIVSIKSASGETKTNDSFRTGDKITITGSDGTKTYTAVIYGDVNGDGMIDKKDLLNVQSSVFGYSTLSDVKGVSADVNKDGKIDKKDLLSVQSQVFGYSKIDQG